MKIADTEEVISVFESKTHAVHTTHSWDFRGISSRVSLQPKSIQRESDVIIGSIDGGDWPESKSFNDEGLGPIPKIFKGTSLNPTGLEGSAGIIPANDAVAKEVSTTNASFFKVNTSNNATVLGKIAVCSLEGITDDRVGKSGEVKRSGGVGMIFVDPIAKV